MPVAVLAAVKETQIEIFYDLTQREHFDGYTTAGLMKQKNESLNLVKCTVVFKLIKLSH